MNFISNIVCGKESSLTNSCCTAADTVSLSMLKAGSRGTIKKFIINCDDLHTCRFAFRLKEMGVYEGARFEILQNSGDGEITAMCEGTRIAIGRGMASKIAVELTDGALLDESMLGRLCRRFGIGCSI